MKAYLVGVAVSVITAASASAEPPWKPGQGRCMTPVHGNLSVLRLDAAMLEALRGVGIAPSGFSEVACRDGAAVARLPAPRIHLAGQP